MYYRITGWIIVSLFGNWSSMAVAQPPQPTPTQDPAGIVEPQAGNSSVQRSATSSVLDEESIVEAREEMEFLTRGPLHEAFANPYQSEGKPLPVVPHQPPEPINELPPEYQPDGSNVVWISGYWAWDEQREDFVWVSGVWRDVPPGQRWVPGYWQSTADGYRWVAGFWLAETVEQMTYLPQPPVSPENGPSTAPASSDQFYIPGQWSYVDQGYRWVPGYWAPVQPNWVWIPAQYIWTPRGYVYQPGYWDYALNRRGVLFTPVHFHQAVYASPRYAYRPRFVVDTGLPLLIHLFLRSSTRQYYFGDYYGGSYGNQYSPWVNYYGQGRYYDPLYAFYWTQRLGNNQRMTSWIGARNSYFAKNQSVRPPKTLLAQQNFLRHHQSGRANLAVEQDVLRTATMADELQHFVQRNDRDLRFRPVDQKHAIEIRDQVRKYDRVMVQQRLEFEKGSQGRTARVQTEAAVKSSKFPASMVRSNQKGQAGQEMAGTGRGQARGTDKRGSDYWENLRKEGRSRPGGTQAYPQLYNPQRIKPLPPTGPGKRRANADGQGGPAILKRAPSTSGKSSPPETRNRQGSGSAGRNMKGTIQPSGNRSGTNRSGLGNGISGLGNQKPGGQKKSVQKSGGSPRSGGQSKGRGSSKSGGSSRGKGRGKG